MKLTKTSEARELVRQATHILIDVDGFRFRTSKKAVLETMKRVRIERGIPVDEEDKYEIYPEMDYDGKYLVIHS